MLTVDQKGLRPEVYTSDSEVIKLGWRIDRPDRCIYFVWQYTESNGAMKQPLILHCLKMEMLALKSETLQEDWFYTAQSYFAKGDNIFKVSSGMPWGCIRYSFLRFGLRKKKSKP